MSSQALLKTEETPADVAPKSGTRKCLEFCGIGCGSLFVVVFALAWLLQGIMYAWATTMSGCRPSSLKGFNFDGDADAKEDPAVNLMPRLTLLTERNPKKFVMPFYVFPSNEASNLAGGQVGTWWRTWGPIFYTYTYEDISSKTTIYMRRNLLRLGSSHRIARCDGKPPYITFTEGSNWLGNRIRSLLDYNQAMTFKIYIGNELVAIAEEATGEVPSLTFRNTKNDFLGSSVLLDPSFHGTKAHWLVKNNKTTPLPYFVENAASLLFAFHTITVEEAHAEASPSSLSATRAFDAVPNVSSTLDSAVEPAARVRHSIEDAAEKVEAAKSEEDEAAREDEVTRTSAVGNV